MVVRDSERPPIMAEHSIENLADRKRRSVDRPFANNNQTAHAVPCVADQDDHTLTAKSRQVQADALRNVLGAPQCAGARLQRIACELAEPKSGQDRSSLRRANSRLSCQLLWPCARKLDEAAILREQRGREVDCPFPTPAVPQDEREQLSLAQGVESAPHQSLARPLMFGKIDDDSRHNHDGSDGR
jgi:hypothetical protein